MFIHSFLFKLFGDPDIEKRCSGGVQTEVYTNVEQVQEAVASQLLDSDIFKEVTNKIS